MANAEDLVRVTASFEPQVLLQDANRPHLDLRAAIRWLGERAPNVFIVPFMVAGDAAEIQVCVRADALVRKPLEPDKLLRAIQAFGAV